MLSFFSTFLNTQRTCGTGVNLKRSMFDKQKCRASMVLLVFLQLVGFVWVCFRLLDKRGLRKGHKL